MTTKDKEQEKSFFKTSENYKKLVEKLCFKDIMLLIKVVEEAQHCTIDEIYGKKSK